MRTAPYANESGFLDVLEQRKIPKMWPVIFLSSSVEIPTTVSFHNAHRTSRAFSAVSKITSVVCLLYTGMVSRFRLMMLCMLRCRCIQMSRYDVLMCVDMSMATKTFLSSLSRSKTFFWLKAQEIHAYLVIAISLFDLMIYSPLRSFVECNTLSALWNLSPTRR